MKNRLVLLLLIILSVSLLFSPNAFSEDTVVRVAPRPILGDLRDDNNLKPVIVDIIIENGQNVAGYQVMLQFDSIYLEYAGIQYGDYLPNDAFFGEPQIIDIDSNDPFKAVRFAATSFADESNGDGILATFTFNINRAEGSDLTLLDRTLLSNKEGQRSVPIRENSRTFLPAASDLVIEAVQAIHINTTEERYYYNKAEEFELRATVRNKGNLTSAAGAILIFYGPAPTNTEKGDRLGEATIAELDPNRAIDISLSDLVTVPDEPGTYYYTVCLGNECSKIEIKVEEPPDLIVESVTADKTTLSPGGTFTLTATLKNQGVGSADTPIYYRWHRSTHPNIHGMTGSERVLSGASEEIGETRIAATVTRIKKFGVFVPVPVPAILTPNQSSNQSIDLTAPEEPGTYYYHVCVESPLPESDPDNNCSADVEITVELADLVVEGINVESLLKEFINLTTPFEAVASIAIAPDDPILKLDDADVSIIGVNWEDIANGREPYDEVLDVNDDGSVSRRDFDLVEFALKLDVNKDGLIDGGDVNDIAAAIDELSKNPKYDINDDGVVNDQDQAIVNTAVKYVLKKTIPGWTFPENLISEVAYGENSTYFVFNPRFAQNENNAVGYRNTITLHIPETKKITNWDQPLDKLLNSLPKEYPYFMVPLFPPDVEGVMGSIAAAEEDVLGSAISFGWAVFGLIPVNKLSEGVKAGVKGVKLLKNIYNFLRALINVKTPVVDLNDEQKAIIERFLQPFENPKVTIRDPSIFFPDKYGQEKNVIDYTPSFLIMIPKRVQSIRITMQQRFVFVSRGRPTNAVSLKILQKPSRIKIEYLDGIIVKVQPLFADPNPFLINFLKSSLNNSNLWMYEEGDDKDKAKEDTKKILTDLLQTVQNTPIGEKLVKDMDNGFQFLAPRPDADEITFFNYWVLGHTLAAPHAQPMSLVDYPPFQQLPPEIQDYLLQHFEGTATPKTLNPELWEIPKQTSLLANYPNPFNPETWIPYQLAEPADVTLTIYDIQGRVVRDLDLGHQRAGMYHGQSRAAYWDGKNAVGESVASGLYFYTLTAGEFTATRKMLIRK